MCFKEKKHVFINKPCYLIFKWIFIKKNSYGPVWSSNQILSIQLGLLQKKENGSVQVSLL